MDSLESDIEVVDFTDYGFQFSWTSKPQLSTIIDKMGPIAVMGFLEFIQKRRSILHFTACHHVGT